MIKRLFWFLAVLFVTADSFLAADLLMSKISTQWEDMTSLEVAFGNQPKSRPAGIRYSDYMVITKRNLFKTADLKKQEEAARSQEPKPQEVKSLAPLKLKLLGTIVGSIPDPRAIILDLNTQKQDMYREGEMVTEATIVKIFRNKVVLNHGGNEEILLAFESEGSPSGRGNKPPDHAKQVEQPGSAPLARFDLGRLGRRVSQNRWELDRSEVDRAVENASQLLTQIRIVPHFDKGQLNTPDGFQIANVKQGGFFDKLGIMPGDIVKEVNGEAVNSPEKAYAAYLKFKNEPNIKVVIERQNQLQTLTYDIP
ncbi:MAG: type II secretion system protein GspC [bacterium]